MHLSGLVNFLRRSLLDIERRVLKAAGFDRHLGPALAVNGPCVLPQLQPQSHNDQDDQSAKPSFLDNIFWMAVPKKRRTIEINRTRRRDERKLIQVKTNIEPCPECGHPKQKHILCGFCYEKVRKETSLIRGQIKAMEGRPLNDPTRETVILYSGEVPSQQDKDKRVVERSRKRPSWFNLY